MASYPALFKKTEAHVTEMFHRLQPEHLVFHNLEHTASVVKKVIEIAGQYNLDEEDMMVVFIAAWFHDTGYLLDRPENHEFKSVEIMKEFMLEQKINENVIAKIEKCILSTRVPRNPLDLNSEILCDADTYQFGSKKEFKRTNELAFLEACNFSEFKLLRSEFDENTIKLLTNHKFYTTYCKQSLNNAKKDNIKRIKKNMKTEEKQSPSVKEITEKDGTTKGMQTMLRLTSSNHIKLSDMADSKANILISVNAIIISVILSVLVKKFQTDPYLIIPTIVFLSFSVITIVISILATRPKLNTGTFEEEDIINKKTNLLFFGNFHRMSYQQYETAMRTMMKDSDYLYSSIVQDIFHLGQVLGKKYRLIRLAYNIFMFGIIASVVAFSVAAMFNSSITAETVIKNSTGSPF